MWHLGARFTPIGQLTGGGGSVSSLCKMVNVMPVLVLKINSSLLESYKFIFLSDGLTCCYLIMSGHEKSMFVPLSSEIYGG